jgi:hypothetical protein
MTARLRPGIRPLGFRHVCIPGAKASRRIDASGSRVYTESMEVIMVKVPDGTKARLRRLTRDVSALLREQIDGLLQRRRAGSAHQKASRLCGVVQGGRRNVSTSRDYLEQYAPKRPH